MDETLACAYPLPLMLPPLLLLLMSLKQALSLSLFPFHQLVIHFLVVLQLLA